MPRSRSSRLRGGLTALLAAGLPVILPLLHGAAVAETLLESRQQVNHLVADDADLVWTFFSKKKTGIRRSTLDGLMPSVILEEPTRDRNQFQVGLAQLALLDDRIAFTRVRVGLTDSWSIRTVNRTGTGETTVLAEERGAEPLFLHGWRVIGGKIVFVLVNGAGTGLPDDTELVAYDPATGTHTPLLIGRYRTGQMGIVAVDATHIYVRGFSRNSAHEIGRVALAGGDATYERLLAENRADRDIAEPGLVLNGKLYFWSRKQGEPHRLLALPVAGGIPEQLLEGKFGFGLSTDSTRLYWVKDGKLLCLPATGGAAPTTLARKLFETASLGGLPIRSGQIYYVRRLSRKEYRIERIPLPN